jgi:hypothetical protein
MKPIIYGIAALSSLALLYDHLPLSAAQDSNAAIFLRDKCGYRPEAARENKAPFDSPEFVNLARVSEVMNGDSNIKLFDAMTQLRLFWWDKHGRADNDAAAYKASTNMDAKVADQIDAMVVRAAQCGAAYGIVSKGG